jgi:hypothetical protein
VGVEKLLAEGGAADEGAAGFLVTAFDEAAVVGVFPDREPRTRRPPGVHHFGVGSRFGAEPFEEVEDQGFDGFNQGDFQLRASAVRDLRRIRQA